MEEGKHYTINPTTGCWDWIRYKNPDGYGCWEKGKKLGSGSHLAHRISYELKHGLIPDGLIVRHKCRGRCVNVDHLELGSVAENNKDLVRDGVTNKGKRFPTLQGQNHYRSKLTEDQVREIRRRHAEPYSQLAKEFGIHKSTLGAILLRQTWRHVGLE